MSVIRKRADLMAQPFSVPSTLQPELVTPKIPVPDVITGENLKEIPAWEYKQWSIFDFLHTKLGIAIITSIATFGILAYQNPPFVQEKTENTIETGKPSMSAIYTASFAVFLVVYLLPLVPRSSRK